MSEARISLQSDAGQQLVGGPVAADGDGSPRSPIAAVHRTLTGHARVRTQVVDD